MRGPHPESPVPPPDCPPSGPDPRSRDRSSYCATTLSFPVPSPRPEKPSITVFPYKAAGKHPGPGCGCIPASNAARPRPCLSVFVRVCPYYNDRGSCVRKTWFSPFNLFNSFTFGCRASRARFVRARRCPSVSVRVCPCKSVRVPLFGFVSDFGFRILSFPAVSRCALGLSPHCWPPEPNYSCAQTLADEWVPAPRKELSDTLFLPLVGLKRSYYCHAGLFGIPSTWSIRSSALKGSILWQQGFCSEPVYYLEKGKEVKPDERPRTHSTRS
jgi:hypothetical protein